MIPVGYRNFVLKLNRKAQKKKKGMSRKVAGLEREVLGQQVTITILLEFCKSVAAKEGLSLLSYQQLNSPSADSRKKVRMLLQKIRKL